MCRSSLMGLCPEVNSSPTSKEFQNTLMAHEEDLARNLVESLLVYALGRDIEFTDEPHIEKIMTKLRPNSFSNERHDSCRRGEPAFLLQLTFHYSPIQCPPSLLIPFHVAPLLRKGAYGLALLFSRFSGQRRAYGARSQTDDFSGRRLRIHRFLSRQRRQLFSTRSGAFFPLSASPKD